MPPRVGLGRNGADHHPEELGTVAVEVGVLPDHRKVRLLGAAVGRVELVPDGRHAVVGRAGADCRPSVCGVLVVLIGPRWVLMEMRLLEFLPVPLIIFDLLLKTAAADFER